MNEVAKIIFVQEEDFNLNSRGQEYWKGLGEYASGGKGVGRVVKLRDHQ